MKSLKQTEIPIYILIVLYFQGQPYRYLKKKMHVPIWLRI